MKATEILIVLSVAFGLNLIMGRFLKRLKKDYKVVETSEYGLGLRSLSIRVMLYDDSHSDKYLEEMARKIISKYKSYRGYTIWIYYPGDDISQRSRIVINIGFLNIITIDRLN